MQEPRRHHYVPSVLLKGFTLTGDKSGILHVFDPKAGTSRQETPERHGWLLDYNRIDGDNPTKVESDFFSGIIESPAGDPLKKIRSDEALKRHDYEALVAFVAAQGLRTPARRESVDRFLEKIVHLTERLRAGRDLLIDDPLIRHLSEGGTLKNEDYHAAFLPRIVDMAESLLTRHCVILTATGSVEFICTDDPVIAGSPGEQCAGLHDASYVAMPCGRRHALLFFDEPGLPAGIGPVPVDDTRVAMFNFDMIRRSPLWIASAQSDFLFCVEDGSMHNRDDVKHILYQTP